MEFLHQYFFFLAKTLTAVIAIGFLTILIFSASSKEKAEKSGTLKVIKINKRFEQLTKKLNQNALSKSAFKAHEKQLKKRQKKADDTNKPRLFTLNFIGDLKASAVKHLREEITAILMVANKHDAVLINIESSGGAVHCYGLAASQLQRLKQADINLTVVVDKVAASGGYLMACVADTIIAAPFAIIGSIGVIAQIPNIHRLLKNKQVDIEQITGGKYKRTLTMLGKNTEEGRKKLQSEVNETHELFKQFVKDNRSKIAIEKVATGEHWYGTQALALGLVDKIQTSDDYLLKASHTHNIFELKMTQKKTLSERLAKSAHKAGKNIVTSIDEEIQQKEYL